MSTTIKSIYGKEWEIGKSFDDEGSREVSISSLGDSGRRLFKVADVLAAMKAEGVLDAVEIITELPEVEEGRSGSLYVGGGAYGMSDGWEDGSKHRAAALRSLALARYCEARHAEKAAADVARQNAEVKLAHRRNEVARSIGAHPDYEILTDFAKGSVDRIIELEDQLAAK